MMKAETHEKSTQQERQLTITRTFNAPCHLVFKAWTQPEHFARWLGPQDFTTTFCQMDVQLGGTYRVCIRSPEGNDHWMQGVYHEVVEPERLVFTFAWEDENGKPTHQTLITVALAAQGSETRLTFDQMIFESVESRNLHQSGWAECFDRLEGYLADVMRKDV